MNLGVPKIVGKFLSSYTTGGFSRRAQLHEVRKFESCNAAFCRILARVQGLGL
jgi:hypothetical protein